MVPGQGSEGEIGRPADRLGAPGARTLPPELAFLPASVGPPGALQRVADRARDLGMSPERVLLAEGFVTSERYYRLLASHLDLPFAERPLVAATGATLDAVLRDGVLPLAPNAFGWSALVAPSATLLRRLLVEPSGGSSLPGLAVTSPDRLEALIRQSHRGAVVRTASHGLPGWSAALSAHGGLSARQKLGMGCGAAALAVVTAWAPAACLDLLALLFSAGFLLACAVRAAATIASPAPRPMLPPPHRLADRDLPVYSVVVPLYREAREVRRLIDALGRLDYPRAKLDILLMIEANDRGTLAALECLALPACFRTIMAPPGHPQTKPRALNVALQFVRGAFLVVYDAEDEPEPSQLRAALARFAALPDAACLQARLAIDNTEDSWLTRLFGLEYAALFDVVNPGLATLRCPVPLGGTSNHFRTAILRRLSGWDAWNVTEDIDLGVRLARFGHRVATLDSTTFEEAPRTLRAWLGQRRRWQKGWMVTLATHTRAPLRTWAELGFGPGLALWAVLCGTVASALLGPVCTAVLALRLWSGTLLHPRTSSEMAWSTLSGVLAVAGLLGIVVPAVVGAVRRGRVELLFWLPALPAYFALLSLAAWQAAFEVAGRPYSWTKTEHGQAKRRARAPASRR